MTCSCRFVRLKTGLFVKSVQLDKSELLCKTRLVEDTGQLTVRLPSVKEVVNDGFGAVDCDVQTFPPEIAAASLPPSAEDAMETQSALGKLLVFHVAPELVEV